MREDWLHICLDGHQAAVLWYLDRVWEQHFDAVSPFADAVQDYEEWIRVHDPGLSKWAIPGSKVKPLGPMLVTLLPYLTDGEAGYARAVICELRCVVEDAYERREGEWARLYPGRPLPALWADADADAEEEPADEAEDQSAAEAGNKEQRQPGAATAHAGDRMHQVRVRGRLSRVGPAEG